MTTIAQMIDAALLHGSPVSTEYRRGMEDVLRFKMGGQPIRCPFLLGTAQADAYFAGNVRGHALYRAEAKRVADAKAAMVERVFFADADAL